MELFEAIHARRSIRKFHDTPVSEEDVKTILQAAMIAPSAGNAQPWQFVVINDRAILDKCATIHPYVKMCETAPLAILVCGDTSLEKYPGFWSQDCSAATMNILYASHGLGYGAVWTGAYPLEDRIDGFRELLNLPESVIPFALIPIGRPDQKSGHQDRYNEDRVHTNGW